MDESALISALAGRTRLGQRADVVLGIGDDGAVLRFEPGFDLVVATDTIIAGTHFPLGTPASAIGHRCLAVNLSDLAAMAAEPLWFSLALSLPEADAAWVDDFSSGLFALADEFNVVLIGGDTVRGPLGATVTVHGRVRPGEAVRRNGARPGDSVWITGHPGDAVAGRLLPENAAGGATAVAHAALLESFRYPRPRVREGQALAGIASAMLDVSDGLDDDLNKLLAASGVGAELDAGALPLSVALRTLRGEDAVRCALTGGDDYELCFTVKAADESRLRSAVASWPVPVSRLGTVTSGAGTSWQLGGQRLDIPADTFRHF